MFLVCGQLTYSGDVDFLRPSLWPAPAGYGHAPTSHITLIFYEILPEILIFANSARQSNSDDKSLMN